MQAAVDAAISGDVVLLAPGTYLGGVFVNGKAIRLASRFHTTGDTSFIAQTIISGVASNMCSGRSDCQGGAVIEFGTSAHGSAVIGLTLTDGTDGIRSRSMADITNCRIIGTGDGTDYSGGGGGVFSNSLFANNRDDGIDLNGRVDVRILNNIVRDNGDDGIEFRLQQYSGALLTTEIIGNRFTGNREDGIQLIDYPDVSSRVVRIERNFFSNNTDAAVGCMANGNTTEDLSGAPMPERVLLINNTFSGEHYGYVGGANVVALNNVFVGTQASALRRVGGNSIASYNMFWNNGTHYESSNIDPAHTLVANPLLATNGSLTAGSPAIDAGIAVFQWQGQTVLNLPASAYSGSAPDLGAFESVGSSVLSIACVAATTVTCPASPSFPAPTVTGACGANPSLTFVDVTTPGACPGRATVTRTWTVTDACGRSASCSQTVTIQDDTAPTISGVGGAWTIECGSSPVFSEPTATDACTPNPTLSFADVTTPGTCAQSSTVTRTWTATDACGNRSTASQSITIQDRTSPTVVSDPADVVLQCPTTPEFGVPSFSDGCDNSLTVTFADENLPATCPAVSVVKRTWTATDDCGNFARCSQTLTVRDLTPPVIAGVGGPATLECPATPQFSTPAVSDACDPSPQLSWADVTAPGSCPQETSVTRTWTATDACGNVATASQSVTIRDRAPPTVVSSPPDVTLLCPASLTFGTPVFADACDNALTVTFADQDLPASCPAVRRVMRTWSATDRCGNSATSRQTLTLEDRAPPTITGVGGATTIECPATPQFSSPGRSDQCDPNPTLTFSDVTTPGACAQEYSVTRTWIATDACGNAGAPVSQTVTVRDRTAPSITGVGGTLTLEAPATPVFGNPTAGEACDPSPRLTFVDVTTPGSCAHEYTVTRTWTATDACGNSSQPSSQTIRVEDNVAPVITLGQSPATIECPATPQFGNPSVTDAVDPSPRLTFVDVTGAGGCAAGYSVTRTWSATDACGNVSTASRTVTVVDRTVPSISGVGGPQTIVSPATPVFGNPTASDACDPSPNLTFSDATTPGACPQTYSVTRTWTATDACGNSSIASRAITVEDRAGPVIVGVGAPQTIECPEKPVFSAPSATDAGGGTASLAFSDAVTPGACAQQYAVTRTWTATDACGNASSASQTITIEDHTAPSVEGVGAAQSIEASASPQFSTPTASDACDLNPSLSFTDLVTPGACPQQYTVTRTWSATDACGNTSAAVSQVIQVEDHDAPLISGVEGPLTLEGPATPEFGNPTVSDAGDPNPTLTFVDVTTPGACAQAYAVTRTWSATDACGNASSASRTLTIEDHTAPRIEGVGGAQTLACPATPVFSSPTAADLCDPAPVLTFADVTTPGACPQAYAVTRTWTATDACGNASTASQTLTVEDRTAPVISGIAGPMTIRCPVTPAFALPTVLDNCDPAPTLTFSDVTSSEACPQDYTVTRTWTAADACGNQGSVSQVVTVLADLTEVNLVGNPSFETDASGWRSYGGAELARVDEAFDGTHALQITGPNSNARFGIIDHPRSVAVPAAGTRYRLSAWVRSEANTGTMRIQVREYLEDAREGMTYSSALSLTPEWQLLTVDYVAATSGSILDFMVLNYPDARGEVFLIDNMSIRVATASVLADGSGPELSTAGAIDSTVAGVTLYPTPFRSRGTLSFGTARRGPLRVEILDLAGRRVRQLLDDPDASPGTHRLTLDGRGDNGSPLAPGVYFYRIDAPERVTRGRFILIR